MCEVFFAAATPFFFRGPAAARPPPRLPFRRPATGRPPAGHFISEVAPRNPGHATHFTKGNENPIGNKLGGGPSGGAHEPPPASTSGRLIPGIRQRVEVSKIVTATGIKNSRNGLGIKTQGLPFTGIKLGVVRISEIVTTTGIKNST